MHPLARLDHRYVWHPFTQMRDWVKGEPILIVRGCGSELRDVRGRTYLDANSSIWTNLHGHNHPRINRAIQRQCKRIAHSSALGLANEPAAILAKKLILAANRIPAGSALKTQPVAPVLAPTLTKVFFSDNGSTALEVAVKLAFEYSRRAGLSKRPAFLSLQGGYHGDTVGAVSLGHIDLFHKAYSPLLFKTHSVMAPYCYRCPYNRAKPERADARTYRKCKWECLERLENKFSVAKRTNSSYSAFVFEPLMQGAAGMIAQPQGWLSRACQIARDHGALLIADEVMTGFGRTGGKGDQQHSARSEAHQTALGSPSLTQAPRSRINRRSTNINGSSQVLFACHHEGVQPDLMAVAKGLTGGYVPMAATLTSQAVFDAFLGEYEEFKTFFHGHSFTGNQIGAASACASLDLLGASASMRARRRLEEALAKELPALWRHSQVGDIRQVGLVVGVELVKDWRTRESFELRERAGIRVCESMARRGVLTRPVGNVIVLMPPYCTTAPQVRRMVEVLSQSIAEQFGSCSR